MIIVGIDENGLGPRLGPLVATAVSIRTRRYREESLAELGAGLGVTDSKRVTAFGNMAHGESLALAIAQRQSDTAIETIDQLLQVLSIDSVTELRAPCPSSNCESQCWGASPLLPVFGGSLAEGTRLLDQLESVTELRVERAQSALLCARRFNQELSTGKSKFRLDVELFERLAEDAQRHFDSKLRFICGMVGGIRDVGRYASRSFSALELHKVEKNGTINYRHAQLGRLSFEIDADARHLPVSIASMVGKYLREIWMMRINRFYQGHDASLASVSGYHDPRTRVFVEQSIGLRHKLGVLPECFERSS